jgi:hypothetical protein
MTATYLGSLTLGGALPGGVLVGAAGVAGINGALPTLLDQLTALTAFAPTPVSFSAQIAGLNAMITGLQLSITAGLVPPSVDLQLAELAAMLAALQAQISSIQLQLEIVTDFQSALGAAGVHAVAFEGVVGALAGDVGSVLAAVPISPIDTAHAVVLVTTVPATWAAMAQLFKVAP